MYMKAPTYKTIAEPAEGIYKEKGSKFLAFAYPVTGEQDVKRHLQTLRQRFHDARHVCYAYRLGKKPPYTERANDDGEPSKSAGIPILQQIRKYDLTDTLVAVVRYFGGVKLGVGGLKRAYKTAAEDALQNATVTEKEITIPVQMQVPYEKLDTVLKFFKNRSWSMGEALQENAVILQSDVPETLARELRQKFPAYFPNENP